MRVCRMSLRRTKTAIISWCGSFVSSYTLCRPWCLYSFSVWYLSLVTRKPVFGVCDQVKLKPAYSASETRWRLEISDIKTRGIILSKQRVTKALNSLCGCAGWSASLLFANGKNRFSHDVTHLPGVDFDCIGSGWLLQVCHMILAWTLRYKTSGNLFYSYHHCHCLASPFWFCYGHLLGMSCPFAFPFVSWYAYLMSCLLFVLLSRLMSSSSGCEIRLYRFLIIAFYICF